MNTSASHVGVVCLCFASLLGCASLERRFSEPPVFPGAPASEDYDSVVVLRDTTLVLSLAGYDRTEKQQILVVRPGGRRWSRVFRDLDHETQLIWVRARSFGPNGEDVQNLSSDSVAYSEIPVAPGIAFPQLRRAIFDVPGVSAGDVIEVEVHTRVTGGRLERFVFDDFVPVLSSRLTVVVPSGWELGWSYSDGRADPESEASNVGQPKIETEEEAKRYVWERRHLPAIEDRSEASELGVSVKRAPEGVARAFATWDQLGGWYRDLSAGLTRLSPAFVADVARDVPEPSAESLFEYVRDHIRYVAYYREGIDGYRPHSADEVMRLRFGDCKDMATLLIALYEAFGITGKSGARAFPVLIHSRGRPFDRELPTPSVFDHAIVGLLRDGAYTFLDPTDKSHAFALPGYAQRGQTVLVVKPDAAELVEVPFARPEQHGLELQMRVRRDGTAHLQGKWTGFFSEGLEAYARTPLGEDAAAWLDERLAQRWPGAKVRSATITARGTEVSVIAELEHGRVPSAEAQFWPLAWFFDGAQEMGLSSSYDALEVLPRRWRERVVLELPPGASPALPKMEPLSADRGSLVWTAKAVEGGLELVREVLLQPEPGEDRDTLEDAVNVALRSAVMLDRKEVARAP